MALFITQCPHCMTCFRTSVTQLQSADGMVRCGACLKIFVADDNLVPSPDLRTVNVPVPEENEQQLPLEDVETEITDSIFTLDLADSLPNRREPAISEDQPIWELLDEEAPAPLTQPEPSTAPNPDQNADVESDAEPLTEPLAEPQQTAERFIPSHESPEEHWVEELLAEEQLVEDGAPSFSAADFHAQTLDNYPGDNYPSNNYPGDSYTGTHTESQFTAENLAAARDISDPLELHWQPETGGGGRIILMSLLALLLTAGLFAQFVWYNLNELSQNITLRPWLERTCNLVNCSLPPLIDIRAISSDNLLVRSHTEIANALTVNLVFRNNASFAQPFPALTLRFTDVNNSVVAERLFTPEEYLPTDLSGMTMMPPGAPVQITLDVLDPGSTAINYEVSFNPMSSQPRR